MNESRTPCVLETEIDLRALNDPIIRRLARHRKSVYYGPLHGPHQSLDYCSGVVEYIHHVQIPVYHSRI